MLGLSEEDLEDRRKIAISVGDFIRAQVISDLLNECYDLYTWLPIENATKDRPLWLFNGVKCLAQWNDRFNAWHVIVAISSDSNSYDRELDFTHYKELPPDPTCGNSADT